VNSGGALRTARRIVVVPEGIWIDAWEPGVTRDVPAFALDDFLPLLCVTFAESIHVEVAIQVVILVLEDASEPTGCLELHQLTAGVETGDLHMVAALEREAVSGSGQAPLHLLFRIRSFLRNAPYETKAGIDERPALGGIAGVRVLPMEDTQTDPDLRGGQAYSAGRIESFIHISDEAMNLFINGVYRLSSAMENRLTVNHNGAYRHPAKFLSVDRHA
jgi:hypothetical protein